MAREKLLAKRLLPFTSSQKSIFNSQLTQQPLPKISEETVPKNLPKPGAPKKVQFQPKVATSAIVQNKSMPNVQQKPTNSSTDLKTIIEKKRQEALMKLRRRQIQSK